MTKVDQIIEEARDRILSIEGDFEEGWPSYDEETLNYAFTFLKEVDKEIAEIVKILPASHGSIDLWWKEDKFEMLVNFNIDGEVSYYGDNHDKDQIKGITNNSKLISDWISNITR